MGLIPSDGKHVTTSCGAVMCPAAHAPHSRPSGADFFDTLRHAQLPYLLADATDIGAKVKWTHRNCDLMQG